MSSYWENPKNVDQLIIDMDQLASELRLGTCEVDVDLTNRQALHLLVAAVGLAGELTNHVAE